jgi:hypothetical protein
MISAPTKEKGFEGKKLDVDNVKGGYKGKMNNFQNYNTKSFPFK